MSDEATNEIDIDDIPTPAQLHAAAEQLPALAPALREMASYTNRMILAAQIGDVGTYDAMESRCAQIAEQLTDEQRDLIASVLDGDEAPAAQVMANLPDDLPNIDDEKLAAASHDTLNDLIDEYRLDVSKSLKLDAKRDAIGAAVVHRLAARGQATDEILETMPQYVQDAAERVLGDLAEHESVREKARIADDAEVDEDDAEGDDDGESDEDE